LGTKYEGKESEIIENEGKESYRREIISSLVVLMEGIWRGIDL
jgi:hypothetical protein